MSESMFPKGPWVWGHLQAGPDYPSEHEFEAALYAPNEVPAKRFVLEAHSIGDGDAISIKNLIAAAPDLYRKLELARFTIAMEIATMGPRTLDREEKEALIAEHPAIKLIDAALAKARGES